jgi:hypothetical protein
MLTCIYMYTHTRFVLPDSSGLLYVLSSNRSLREECFLERWDLPLLHYKQLYRIPTLWRSKRRNQQEVSFFPFIRSSTLEIEHVREWKIAVPGNLWILG